MARTAVFSVARARILDNTFAVESGREAEFVWPRARIATRKMNSPEDSEFHPAVAAHKYLFSGKSDGLSVTSSVQLLTSHAVEEILGSLNVPRKSWQRYKLEAGLRKEDYCCRRRELQTA